MSAARPIVLVAEDDHEMRRLVADALRRDGYDVDELADGGRLLVRIALGRAEPDLAVALIVSDIRMPGCSGLDVLQGLRDEDWRMPVILMTAFGDDEVRERATGLGATLFDKPFALGDLRAAVRALLPR
jgi:DNA-binding response OmpR family regulator